jgi:phosphatidylserine/phosphatidylglycerophosphate/cardiolipin synthase-like enzyme
VSSDARAEADERVRAAPDPACRTWFLSSAERRNPATSIDDAGDGEAWTTGNRIELHHGHDYYRALHRELNEAGSDATVLFTDWRGDPDELLDGPGTAVVDVLCRAAQRGVRIKGLIWRSHPDRVRFSEEENRDLAAEVNEAGGEVLLDERVRRAGSHHQKLFVVLHHDEPSRDVAFVGGIDLCHGRNDDESHRGDPQPVAMNARFGPTPAWHDLQAEIHGPAVAQIAETFRERWNDPAPLRMSLPIPIRRLHAPAPNEPLAALRAANDEPRPGSQSVQVLRTYPCRRPRYPFAPQGERSIALAYLKAFRRARRLIYIEDQYLWAKDAALALGQALQDQPELRLVVVVPRYPDVDGRFSGPPNRIGQIDVISHLKGIAGPRFAVYDLETERFPIYVHAKVCIIDDVWMTIGSDNLNRRSWTHDSELSCAVLDARRDDRMPTDPAGLGDGARVLARSTRLSLWSEHLAMSEPDVPVDPHEGFDLLRASADRLDEWHAAGHRGPRPLGRLRNHLPEPVAGLRRLLASGMYRVVNDPDGRPISLRLRRSF